VATDTNYWPSGYLMGISALLNPTIAAILLGMNHERLGEAKNAREFYLVSVVLGLSSPPSSYLSCPYLVARSSE
jgi:hypothetical protein